MGDARLLRQLPSSVRRKKASYRALERAVARFLHAAGVDLNDPNLRETPSRVAQAWLEELIDGYGRTPEEALGERYPAPKNSSGEMVVVTDLRFHSMCPHHLLPYVGRAHLAYVPGKHVVGFGRLAALVDTFAHRLVLQEDLARSIAEALARTLGSPAAACVLEAEQACLRLRGSCQVDARTHAEAYVGSFKTDAELRQRFWRCIRER